jgi:hypothetical protein
MANKSYWWPTAFTGGSAGVSLDSIDGTGLVDGDYAIVTIGAVHYFYRLAGTSGATEATPGIIAPDANAEDKRWVLQNGNGKTKVGSFTLTASGLIQSVTGVGFTPAIVFFFMHETTGYWTIGADDGTDRCVAGLGYDGAISSGSPIQYRKASSDYLRGYIATMDADGFSIHKVYEGGKDILVHYRAMS